VIGALILGLAEIPALPGAACVGREKLYDATVGNAAANPPHVVLRARELAREVCARCPCLEPCSEWVAALPKSHRPQGMVAGLVVDNRGQLPADREQRATRLKAAMVDACR